MRILLDTNVLIRAVQAHHPQQTVAVAAVASLPSRQLSPCLAPQNLYEFWVVITRPESQNGLGMDVRAARERLDELKSAFEILEETPAIRVVGESLVCDYEVRGKAAHDVRLVAAMKVHGVDTLLTFNKQHFMRYSRIRVITPEEALEHDWRAP